MPFGGHQQICRSPFISWTPFIHLLPLPFYKFLLKAFSEKENTISELLSIRETRITIEMYYRLVKELNLTILKEQFYLINPHYEVKFKLEPILLPRWLGKIPYLRNFFITTCYSVLSAENEIRKGKHTSYTT